MVRVFARTRRPLPVLGLLALVGAVVSGPAPALGAASGEPPAPDVLWLDAYDPLLGGHNFTSFAPPSNGTAHRVAGADHPTATVWMWASGAVPANWTLEATARPTLTLVLRGFQDAYVVPELTRGPDGVLGIPIDVRLTRVGLRWDEVATGTGAIPYDPLAPPSGPVTVEMTLSPRGSSSFAAGPGGDALVLQVSVPARGRTHSPLRVDVLGGEAASRLVLPGFPVEAFRAWEEGTPGALCRYLAWTGGSCAEPPASDPTMVPTGPALDEVAPTGTFPASQGPPDPGPRKAPAFAVVILLALVGLSAGVALARRRRP